MNAVSYSWLSIALSVFHGLLMVVALPILFIGWRRHRQLGYAVLLAWALASLFNVVGQSIFFPFAAQYLQKAFRRADTFLLRVLPMYVGSLISTLLLFAGLALLVFRPPAAPPRE